MGMARTGFLRILLLLPAAASLARAQDVPVPTEAGAPHPFEIVKEDIDLEADASGHFWESRETWFRPLTTLGVQALQEARLSYSARFQTLRLHAYTLKKDGRKLDVPANKILEGQGQSNARGFSDARNITVVYPDLEIGDTAVMITNTEQRQPWFANVFATIASFPRTMAVHEATLAFTSRGDDALFHVTAPGLDAAAPETLGGKTRHVWRYHNDNPLKPETNTVTEIASGPHLEITTLADYAGMAALYAGIFQDKAKPTPEITALADKLTVGITDRRAQARALYEWVAAHIQYVNIVLGAGGFTPHEAGAVLGNGYGDCKDHVMLLQALLTAKGIDSSPVLIRAGANQFKLPDAASPFIFDHLISYVPEFKLFLDSTARYAPFGVLPSMDSGKSVVIVNSGKVVTTPAVSPAGAAVKSETVMTLNPDGSADGDTKVSAIGAPAVDLRGMLGSMPADNDPEFFRGQLGPGSDGSFQRGNPEKLADSYDYSAHFHTGHLGNIPGPGALPAALAYKPFAFYKLIGLDLPPACNMDYVCASGTYDDSVTLNLPKGFKILSLPKNQTLTAPGASLKISYQRAKAGPVTTQVHLVLDRAPVCSASDYAKERPALQKMLTALQSQIVYR
jgi:transglutaminase-like putative cysteine protease